MNISIIISIYHFVLFMRVTKTACTIHHFLIIIFLFRSTKISSSILRAHAELRENSTVISQTGKQQVYMHVRMTKQ